MKKATSISRGAHIAVQAFFIVLVLISLVPLYNVVAASFKTGDEFIGNTFLLPKDPTAANYAFAGLQSKLLRYTLNSLILVPLGLVVYICVCVSAGYAFGKMRFAFRLPLFLVVLFLMIFPQLLLATQVFKLISILRLTNTYIGVILSWVAYFAPFGTYIMTTYFSDMPYELVEASRMDGAGHFRILVTIMTPLAAPMIATIAIIGFQSMWNELPFSLMILQDQASRTVTLGIAMMRGEYGVSVPVLSAGLVIATAVPLLVFIVFQRYVTLGATAGALKG